MSHAEAEEEAGSNDGTSLHNPVLFSRDSDLDAVYHQSNGISTPPETDVRSATTTSTPPKLRPAAIVVPPPASYESIITQTDQHGTPQKVSSPPRKETPSSPVIQQQRREENTHQVEPSCWRRFWSCCFKEDDGDSGTGRESQMTQTSRGTTKSNSSLPGGRRAPDRYRSLKLLGAQSILNQGRKCLVLDLDETLVHSSFQAVPNPDYIIPVTIDNIVHNVYVLKRPGVDDFMRRMGAVYEVVIFTASLSKYADPLLDELDIHKVISKRLFRESCVLHDGHYVKDLSLLNRDISQAIIVDNSQMSYIFQPENAIDCFSFIDDPRDVELWEIADFLESIKGVKDVRFFCRTWREWCKNNPNSSVPRK